jgi:outer membrane immunogenic protein
MKTRLATAALLIASASAGSAADMAVKAPSYLSPVRAFSWSGFYAGVHIGYGWAQTTGPHAEFLKIPHLSLAI